MNLLFTIVNTALITFVNMINENLLHDFLTQHAVFRNSKIQGRYLNYDHLKQELDLLPEGFMIQKEGHSELGVPIHSVTIGSGPVKILGWSQMHGNESTTTKALLDLWNFFDAYKGRVSNIIQMCTLRFIPMLNPDGSAKYTRENANMIDLNRDADKLTQSESKVLRSVFGQFNPDFCLNLHDQRTIFSTGFTEKPATLSFLAPAMDEERSIPVFRKNAMAVIGKVNEQLQNYLPGQIGKYDDAFNLNCTGDRFMAFQTSTILFEAGHYQGDYMREETRKYMGAAILMAIQVIASESYADLSLANYDSIPENGKKYFDIILREALIRGKVIDVAIQYREKLESERINFEPIVILMDEKLDSYAHRTIHCKGQKVTNLKAEELSENDIVEGILLNRDNISLKIE